MSIEPRVLAHMATGIENRDPQALAMLEMLRPGHARVVGITGPPGAGKSTLVSAMTAALRRRGQTVAILAVDPSSRRTGGAILGDRIRMTQHYGDAGVFIRSMATRGSLGGLSEATRDLARLMDAAGRDFVLIETVGVGQAEIEIAAVAGITVVVLAPGMGDDVQAIKAGIMEIADVIVVNKADRAGADRAESELRAALSVGEGPQPPVVRTVATDGQGIEELLDLLAALPAHRPTTLPALAEAQAPIAFYAAPGLRIERAHLDGGSGAERILNRPTAGAHLYVLPEPGSPVLFEFIQENAS